MSLQEFVTAPRFEEYSERFKDFYKMTRREDGVLLVEAHPNGGPVDQTHVFASWAFRIGIESNDIPLGACVSLFMFPILAIAAIFILRDIHKRSTEA